VRRARGLVVAALGLFVAPLLCAQERAPGVRRLELVLEVDVERARAVGWDGASSEEAGTAEVVALAAKLVERRFLALERAARITVEERRIRVSLPSIDPRDRELLEGMLRSIGVCELLVLASDSALEGTGSDLARERAKLDAWRAAHPDLPLAAFNALDPGDGGPERRVLWVETEYGGVSGPPCPLLLPGEPAAHFGAASLARTGAERDAFGYPALAFELTDARRDDFTRFAEARVGERLGLLSEGKVRSAPTLGPGLAGGGLIEGRFTDEELARLGEAFRRLEGPLRLVEAR
jgi:preprotein translocase subunit SecD